MEAALDTNPEVRLFKEKIEGARAGHVYPIQDPIAQSVRDRASHPSDSVSWENRLGTGANQSV